MRESCAGHQMGEIDVIELRDINGHRQKYEMVTTIIHWLRQTAPKKCLFCTRQFQTAIEPPDFFFFARAAHCGPKPWLIAGVCRDCKERSDIVDLLTEVVEPFFPTGGELIDASPGRLH